jgi:hypothetical protein
MTTRKINFLLIVFFICLIGCIDLSSISKQKINSPNILPVPSIEKITEMCNKSEIIFIGKVRFVGDPPGGFSGTQPSYQLVVYEGLNILKGEYFDGNMPVLHVIVGGQTVNRDAALRPDIFQINAKMIVFAILTDRGTFEKKYDPDYPIFPIVFDDDYGVIQHSDDLENTIVEILKRDGSLSPLYSFFKNAIKGNK